MPGVDLNLLYTALGSPLGVVVQCNDAKKVQQRLYALRKEAADPDLEALSLVISPTSSTELWIVKRPVK